MTAAPAPKTKVASLTVDDAAVAAAIEQEEDDGEVTRGRTKVRGTTAREVANRGQLNVRYTAQSLTKKAPYVSPVLVPHTTPTVRTRDDRVWNGYVTHEPPKGFAPDNAEDPRVAWSLGMHLVFHPPAGEEAEAKAAAAEERWVAGSSEDKPLKLLQTERRIGGQEHELTVEMRGKTMLITARNIEWDERKKLKLNRKDVQAALTPAEDNPAAWTALLESGQKWEALHRLCDMVTYLTNKRDRRKKQFVLQKFDPACSVDSVALCRAQPHRWPSTTPTCRHAPLRGCCLSLPRIAGAVLPQTHPTAATRPIPQQPPDLSRSARLPPRHPGEEPESHVHTPWRPGGSRAPVPSPPRRLCCSRSARRRAAAAARRRPAASGKHRRHRRRSATPRWAPSSERRRRRRRSGCVSWTATRSHRWRLRTTSAACSPGSGWWRRCVGSSSTISSYTERLVCVCVGVGRARGVSWRGWWPCAGGW